MVEDFDDDNDNWSDYDESLCGTDSLDESDFPTDSDGDGTCDALEDDTDGDGVVDADDAFPMDSSEWLDTDEDGVGNNADDNDDGDAWSDADEDRCDSDPLDSESIPENLDENGGCVATKSEPKPTGETDSTDDNSSSTMWWICVCFPLLLLLLLIPLLYVARERGDSLLVLVGMRNGPEPENTTSNPEFVSGSGTKDDPFVLEPAHVANFGDSAFSKETITITKLDPDSLITITDMATHTNRGRFNMDSLSVEGNPEEKGSGAVVFQLQFDDNITEDETSGIYQAQIRVGSASVYLNWEVKVGDPEKDALKAANAKAKAEKAAAKKEKAVAWAEKNDADKKAKSEKNDADKKAKSEKDAADKKAKSEKDAADKKAKSEMDAADKKSKADADAKAKSEKDATDKKLKEAEDKAAAAEEKAKVAEGKAASEKKARENAEDDARAVAEQAAKERLEQMDKEMEVRRAKLAEMDDATRKKEEELLRISEKAKTIDFATLGVATSADKDDLQRIKGVGPFIEDKLNALGIYTFEQVGNMNSVIEEQVNIAIEFFSGRIKRDKWANQAKLFDKEK